MATIIGSGLESYLQRQAREQALNRIAEAEEPGGAHSAIRPPTRARLIEAETDENTRADRAEPAHG